jgi:hypothetical protein
MTSRYSTGNASSARCTSLRRSAASMASNGPPSTASSGSSVSTGRRSRRAFRHSFSRMRYIQLKNRKRGSNVASFSYALTKADCVASLASL